MALALSGCGGGDDQTFSLGASRTCLGQYGEVTENVDEIAEDASAGAIRLVVDDKEVMIAFARDKTEAVGIEKNYDAVNELFPGQAKPAHRRGNVVIAWTNPPSEAHMDLVENCLRSRT